MPDSNDPNHTKDINDAAQPSTEATTSGQTNDQPTTAPEVPDTPEASSSSSETTKPDEAPADTNDDKTDKAVDDIVRTEGDEVLKAEDAAAAAATQTPSRWQRFKRWWAKPKVHYSALGVLVALIAALFIIPLTRYDLLGLVLKSQVTVQAVDSKTGQPVSGVTVELGGQTAQTKANGKAVLQVHAGSKTLTAHKKYYQSYSHKELVTLSVAQNNFKATMLALGRQVSVKVVNKVTGKPLAGATISFSATKATSDKNGQATVVVASDVSSQKASVTLDGYNAADVVIVPDGTVSQNSFSLTPSGKLYFLSNLSGNIDVVKTNLDGTDRQTVLAGTGSETSDTTSLLASRDWKYLALLANRSGTGADVYLINTSDDKLVTIDQGDATFTLVGWSGDKLIYRMTRTSVQDWQNSQQAIKSYDPATGKVLLLDQTQASGTSANDYVKQYFGQVYLMGSQVVYTKNWAASYADWSQLNSHQAELDSIAADGSSHKTIKTFALASSTQSSGVSVDTELYSPAALYVHFSDGSADQFYTYDGSKLTTNSSLSINQFWSTGYTTYLLSPSGNQTFWSEQRDGKNTLFIGDTNGNGPKQIASLSDYSPYGWYGDNYLLVSKGGSELYIMPASGGTPLKITDYYKPPVYYAGYGGGYGGL